MADRTSSQITINATKADVMAVIADLEAYPDWAEGVREVKVTETGPGGRPARAKFTIDAAFVKDSYVLSYEWDGDDAVRWELVEKGNVVSGLKGAYRLTETAGATEVAYELAIDVRMPMLGMIKRKGEKMLIDVALKGLKKRVER